MAKKSLRASMKKMRKKMRKKMTQMVKQFGTKKPKRKSMRYKQPKRTSMSKKASQTKKKKSTKRKPTEWQKLVMKVYLDMKKKDPSVIYKDAFPEAAKLYKKQSGGKCK